LLLAIVYFFPGVHKLATSGLDWALSENLQHQLWWKWAQHGTLPSLRPDELPGLLQAAGLFVLAFELGFPLLVLGHRTRPFAAALGLGFHLLSRFVFLIPFESLWFCYVVLFDPRRPLRALVRRVDRRSRSQNYPNEDPAAVPLALHPLWLPGAVGGLLLAAGLVQGLRGQMRSYPFACYPTFEWIAPDVMPDLLIAGVNERGQEAELFPRGKANYRRSQREWGEVWSLAGVTDRVDPRRLEGYYAARRPRPAPAPKRVRFYRVLRSVRPGTWAEPPVRRKLLFEFTPAERASAPTQ
jgi:hypothetical protein